MHYELRSFCNFDQMALPPYTGVLYLSFFIVCTAWLKLLTLWMLAVETHSFFSSRIWVPLVGVEWYVYRILVPVFSYCVHYFRIYVRKGCFSVPQLLQVHRCSMSLSCYRSAVVRMTGLSLFCVCLLSVTDWLGGSYYRVPIGKSRDPIVEACQTVNNRQQAYTEQGQPGHTHNNCGPVTTEGHRTTVDL